MSYVTLDEAKSYCNQTHDDDNALFADLIDAAERDAANFLGKPLECFTTSENSPPDLDRTLLPTVKVRILSMISTLYENRENVVTGTIVSENKTTEAMAHFERTGLGV